MGPRRRSKKGLKKLFEEITKENFLTLVKELRHMRPESAESQITLIQRPTPHHMIIKTPKVKTKRES